MNTFGAIGDDKNGILALFSLYIYYDGIAQQKQFGQMNAI